jgi:DNA-directed RNA polymerase specialized sigma24 family protein
VTLTGTDDEADTPARQEWAEHVFALIKRLEDTQSAAIRLVYLEGLTQRQTATRLALPATTIARSILSALQTIAGQLTPDSSFPVQPAAAAQTWTR